MAAAIAIVAGSGRSFGTGHRRRMSDFARWLADRTWPAAVLPLESTEPAAGASTLQALDRLPGRPNVVLLDARDVDPQPYAAGGRRVVALDNRHPSRARIEGAAASSSILFYDTIPHPAAPLRSTLEHALLHPQLARLRRLGPGRGLFVYAPDREHLRRARRILRGLRPARELVLVSASDQLSPDRFRDALRRADTFVTHFGVGMLEAWALRVPTVLWSIGTALHDRLSCYLERAAGIPFLDRAASGCVYRWQGAFERARQRPPQLCPAPDGYERLVEVLTAAAGRLSRT